MSYDAGVGQERLTARERMLLDAIAERDERWERQWESFAALFWIGLALWLWRKEIARFLVKAGGLDG